MSAQAELHAPVGGPVVTRGLRPVLWILALGVAFWVYRFAVGLAAVVVRNRKKSGTGGAEVKGGKP